MPLNRLFPRFPRQTPTAKKARILALSAITGLSAWTISATAAAGASVTWISSTAEQPWQTMPAPELIPSDPAAPPQIGVWPAKTFQTIDGFGGCFNELGWAALGKASMVDRDNVMAALFGDNGCAFTMGRIPIGSSDFALDWYSLDETPGDLDLKDFSIERDKKALIPYIKAAMAVRPSLKCWGSAWSPPTWMKTNNNYSKGSLKWEPPILHSYATYLARWVESYRAEGVNVFAVFTQNEPNVLNNYPTTLWTGPQLREFVADYLGPTLLDRKTNVELWLGTTNDGNFNDRIATVMQDPKANAFITGISFQYDGRKSVASASAVYPDKKLMQSETECNSGKNSWGDAERLFDLMKSYLGDGANSYFAWNMVLNETGMSTWKWRQNALITVNQNSGEVTYNGEYYVMRHFSQFVKPGARRVLTTGSWGDRIAFVNTDGSTVLVVANTSKDPQDVVLKLGDRADGDTIKAGLAPHSVNTFVLAPN
jgi:glucosylceramidase